MSVTKEIKYKNNGRVWAGLILGIALVLFLMNIFEKQNPPPGQPGVLIAFGEPDLGMNDDDNPLNEEESENVAEEDVEAEPEPSPAEPTPSDADVNKDVVTDDASDAPPVKKNPKPKVKPKEKTKPVEKPKEETKKPAKKPKKIKGGSFSPKGKKGKKGKGDNDKPGPTGDPDGGGDSKVGGVTAGGDIGGGLSGRGVRKRSKPVNNTGQFGTVVVKICVSKEGNVISATYTQKGSTTANGSLTSLATRAAKAYKFQANPNAPDKQCGTVTFKFRPG